MEVSQIAQVARHFTTDWSARVRSRVSRGADFLLTRRVQTDPAVHWASYNMSTEGFPRDKGDWA